MVFGKRKRRAAQRAERAGRAAETGFAVLDRRLPMAEGARALLRKAFPDHWSFLLGELALYSFVVLVLTGVYLTLFFDPSMTLSTYHGTYAPLRGLPMTQAYSSTLHITFDVRGGLLIRQIHHWAALLFISAIGVHMLRIFFTGAFRRPREGNWIIGVILLILAMLEGFCGYSLPDDLLSGTGLRTAGTIAGSIPVVGTYLEFFAFGGPYPGHDIIPRLYAVHILLVPGLLVALITVHLILVVYLKHTQFSGLGKTNRNVVGQPMVPQFAAKSTGLSLMVFGSLSALAASAQINPIWIYGPYRPDIVITDAQPDWYVGFLEGALRLMPPAETTVAGHTLMWNVLVPALLMPGVLFTLLILYPFCERWVTGDAGEHHLLDRPRDHPARTAFGVAGVVFYGVLLLAGGNDVVAYAMRWSVNALTWIFRVAVIVGPPLAFMLTKRLCLALQDHERETLTEGTETGRVSQAVHGEISEDHRPVPAEARYRALVRATPRPLSVDEGAEEGEGARARRVRRLRVALGSWYYGDRVEMPATPRQRAEIEARTAPPAHPGDSDDAPERRATAPSE
ncbi:ubiquinol-cytochrome c reductase cytochrome b subunit [Streptantibioticus parmotrematis]|uniref:cytochrome bc1 complex cytochrome b subunit n=1 Tax=Streptantibioticus parmotrematis TaxID=2873249 RepID=UPI0033F0E20D